MPLMMAPIGEVNSIKKIAGRDEIKKFLENLGFIVGGEVTVISQIAGDLIVNVKGAKIAISKEMASRIMI